MNDKVTIERKILEHTVIALEYAYGADDVLIQEPIKSLRTALAAQPAEAQQKPVAWRHNKTGRLSDLEEEVSLADGDEWAEPLYAAPAAQQEPAAWRQWSTKGHDWDYQTNRGDLRPDTPVEPLFVAAAQPGITEQALQKIADFGQDQDPVAWIGLPGKGTPPAPASSAARRASPVPHCWQRRCVMADYLIWCPDLGHDGPDDGKVIKAGEPETAVAVWAQREDAESADYWIVGGTGTAVVVRDQFGIDTTYRVRGEPSINYFARAEPPTPKATP